MARSRTGKTRPRPLKVTDKRFPSLYLACGKPRKVTQEIGGENSRYWETILNCLANIRSVRCLKERDFFFFTPPSQYDGSRWKYVFCTGRRSQIIKLLTFMTFSFTRLWLPDLNWGKRVHMRVLLSSVRCVHSQCTV